MTLLRILSAAVAALIVLLLLAIVVLGDRDIPPAELVERYANEASRFIELDSGTLAHVRDEGTPAGEVLVLAHGSNASLHTWDAWVAELGDEYRLIRFDLPGHGLTGRTVEDDYSIAGVVAFVDELTRKLGATRFHFAGNSMGGRLGWTYALDHPERLEKLVLLDASGFPEPPDAEESLGFRLARTPGLQYLMLCVTPRALFEVSLRDAFADPNLVTDEMVDRYHQLQLREGSRAASLARYRLSTKHPRIAEISNIGNPTLVLWGDEDRLVPVEDAPQRSAADVRAFLRGAI